MIYRNDNDRFITGRNEITQNYVESRKNSKIANLGFPVEEVGRHYLESAQILNVVKTFKVILVIDRPNTTPEWSCPRLLDTKQQNNNYFQKVMFHTSNSLFSHYLFIYSM